LCGVVFRFRSGTDLSELKAHQEKLKTLCPILSLAITSQQNKKAHNFVIVCYVSSRAHALSVVILALGSIQGASEADQFDALRLVTNEQAKQFWAHHFGHKVLSRSSL
jgi:hypothetical protein